MIRRNRGIGQVIKRARRGEDTAAVAVAAITAEGAIDDLQVAGIGNAAAIERSHVAAEGAGIHHRNAPRDITQAPAIGAGLITLHGGINDLDTAQGVINSAAVSIIGGIGKKAAGRHAHLAAADEQPTGAALRAIVLNRHILQIKLAAERRDAAPYTEKTAAGARRFFAAGDKIVAHYHILQDQVTVVVSDAAAVGRIEPAILNLEARDRHVARRPDIEHAI